MFLTSCGVVKRSTYTATEKNEPASTSVTLIEADTLSITTPGFVQKQQPEKIQEIQGFLELAYKDWQSIPYVWGGGGYEGIDCSSFIQIVFEDYFARMLPRTTLEQLRMGSKVRRSSIRTGDLVFFKTGRKAYHVGIMIDKEQFLHASSSNGVKVSSLIQPYWDNKYLVSRRILTL